MAPTISAAWLTLRALDARVLEHDHEAVADRARGEDPRREGGAQVLAARANASSGAASAKRDDGERAAVEPLEDELRQRHGEPPEEARGDERHKSGMTAKNLTMTIASSASIE